MTSDIGHKYANYKSEDSCKIEKGMTNQKERGLWNRVENGQQIIL